MKLALLKISGLLASMGGLTAVGLYSSGNSPPAAPAPEPIVAIPELPAKYRPVTMDQPQPFQIRSGGTRNVLVGTIWQRSDGKLGITGQMSPPHVAAIFQLPPTPTGPVVFGAAIPDANGNFSCVCLPPGYPPKLAASMIAQAVPVRLTGAVPFLVFDPPVNFTLP